MSRVTFHMSISVDGFVAGPDQSEQNPLGIRGIELHQWHLGEDKMKDPIAKAMADHLLAPKGAYVMGRNMFGPIRGEWEPRTRSIRSSTVPRVASIFRSTSRNGRAWPARQRSMSSRSTTSRDSRYSPAGSGVYPKS